MHCFMQKILLALSWVDCHIMRSKKIDMTCQMIMEILNGKTLEKAVLAQIAFIGPSNFIQYILMIQKCASQIYPGAKITCVMKF